MRWWWACVHVNVCTCVWMCAYVVCVYMSWLICANGHHGNEVILNT